MLIYPTALLIAALTLVSVSCQENAGVQIIQINEKTKKFELDEAAVEKILHGPKCRNNPVSVVSIAGATRKGKSFMLNFFIKYLTSGGATSWLGKPDQPLTGFSWRGGYERDTTGILLWSEPFLVKRPNGQDVCVLLMDTQGSFDGRHTVADTAAIFAISTMTSSIQIYNLFDSIQEDDLHHLELFTEYGRLAVEETNRTPFQKLLFLVRDFRFADEFEYGLKGGKEFLDDKLSTEGMHLDELSRVRQSIRSVFEKLECFLMPYPGEVVASAKAFDGKLKDINAEFLDELKVLVPHLFSPKTLVVKKFNGQEVTGRQLLEYFKAYVKVFTGDDIPKPDSIMMATAHADHQAALNAAREFYYNKMEDNFAEHLAPVTPVELNRRQQVFYNQAVDMFSKKPKMGAQQLSQEYLLRLKQNMNDMITHYRDMNDLKHRVAETEKMNQEFNRQAQRLEEERKRLQILIEKDKRDHSAAGEAKSRYAYLIDNQFGTISKSIDPNYLYQKHVEFQSAAEQLYRSRGGDTSSTHMATFRREITAIYDFNKRQNELRKLAEEQAERERKIREEIAAAERRQEELRRQVAAERRANNGGFWRGVGRVVGGFFKAVFSFFG